MKFKFLMMEKLWTTKKYLYLVELFIHKTENFDDAQICFFGKKSMTSLIENKQMHFYSNVCFFLWFFRKGYLLSSVCHIFRWRLDNGASCSNVNSYRQLVVHELWKRNIILQMLLQISASTKVVDQFLGSRDG